MTTMSLRKTHDLGFPNSKKPYSDSCRQIRSKPKVGDTAEVQTLRGAFKHIVVSWVDDNVFLLSNGWRVLWTPIAMERLV